MYWIKSSPSILESFLIDIDIDIIFKGSQMKFRDGIAISLSKLIKKALLKKFGTIPSANMFANQFNLRAHGTKTITQETARKWLQGKSFPEIDKLGILVAWLDLELTKIFDLQTNIEIDEQKSISYSDDALDSKISHYLDNLNPHSKQTLLLVCWMLQLLEKNNLPISEFGRVAQTQNLACIDCPFNSLEIKPFSES